MALELLAILELRSEQLKLGKYRYCYIDVSTLEDQLEARVMTLYSAHERWALKLKGTVFHRITSR